MKIKFIVGGVIAAALGMIIPAGAQTAPEILARMIEAQGGKAVLAAVKDSTTAGTIEMAQMGMSAGLTMYQKEPNKMRMDMDVMGMTVTTCFDGEKGWMINPQTGGVEELSEKQSQSMRVQGLGYGAFLNPDKLGITYTLKGREKVGEKDCWVLEQSFKDGLQSTLYIDASSFLTLKNRTKADLNGVEVEAETLFEDFKTVGGILIAHRMIVHQGGAEFARMTYSKVTLNTGLEDSLFKMK